MDGYWRHCLRNEEERKWVGGVVAYVRKGGEWDEGDYREALERRKRTGKLDEVEEGVDEAAERIGGVRFKEGREIFGEGSAGVDEPGARIEGKDAKVDATPVEGVDGAKADEEGSSTKEPL